MEVPHASPIRLPATKHVCGRTHVNNAFSFPPLQVGLLDFRQVSPPPRPPLLATYNYYYCGYCTTTITNTTTTYCGPTQIFRSWDRPLRTSLLPWSPYTNLPQLNSVRLDVFDCFQQPASSPALLPAIDPQDGFPVLLPSLASKSCWTVWLRMGGVQSQR